jgi:3'-phosphoadenosine 5'-phosphosulfate sulfotransferase (PAPS reductase)/FAD synthetase
MKTAREIIAQTFAQYRPALAYSGGGDSTVLLDIVCAMGQHPPLIYTDSQMEYDSTMPFVQSVADRYGCPLHVARASITPQDCWARHGFPMLGKQSAREWMQRHRGANDFGFRVDVSTCCRKMKIKPGRDLAKATGCNAVLTGQRGAADDRLRALRALKDGALFQVKEDNIAQSNPLTGWTDLMIQRYTTQHGLPVNPQKAAGALTIGCMYCGGGAQFDNSGFRVLRHTDPEAWRRMVVEYGFGPIILSIKHDRPLSDIMAALALLGGLAQVADHMPHVFDFLRPKPLRGYDR